MGKAAGGQRNYQGVQVGKMGIRGKDASAGMSTERAIKR